MSAIDWGPLRTTVQGAIERGQIGRPVSLRMTVHVEPAGKRNVWTWKTNCARSRALGSAGPARPIISVGGERGAAVVALKWAGGQSAILSVSAGGGRTGGNMMLLGSNGVIYHEIDPVADHGESDKVRERVDD